MREIRSSFVVNEAFLTQVKRGIREMRVLLSIRSQVRILSGSPLQSLELKGESNHLHCDESTPGVVPECVSVRIYASWCPVIRSQFVVRKSQHGGVTRG